MGRRRMSSIGMQVNAFHLSGLPGPCLISGFSAEVETHGIPFERDPGPSAAEELGCSEGSVRKQLRQGWTWREYWQPGALGS